MGLAGGETRADNLGCLAFLTASIPLCHNMWLYNDDYLPNYLEYLEHLCFSHHEYDKLLHIDPSLDLLFNPFLHVSHWNFLNFVAQFTYCR